ncbi:MAG: sigma 54-interacting transcriptional regulator [Polyangiaceae bacterium]|nr:sigma 54-interacting transcriptional regulator [Polyangiaceae bacterium]MCW5792153.1 sigma 54-interacting transcriptional regulator [Polyangiaceae bacterium]
MSSEGASQEGAAAPGASSELKLPARYEPLSRLGEGGGGEVWAVRDRHTGERLALKMLSPTATEREMGALVREAVALSGLEGLGVPRVSRFGRLAGSGRPFMLRELVEGQSLNALILSGDAERALLALTHAADQLTLVHRAGLLHGDVKPHNIIVSDQGDATLVDLGLAAPWRESGTRPEGLTPRYAAPELLAGQPLTVRAEVYALGVTLADTLASAAKESLGSRARRELSEVVQRATAAEPTERHPSVDELATAVRRALGAKPGAVASVRRELWPVVGIDATAEQLQRAVRALPRGGRLVLEGPLGSGRSVLLRRLAWSLGVEGRAVVWLDDEVVADDGAVEAELEEFRDRTGVVILVDDAHRLAKEGTRLVKELAEAGARLVLAGDSALGTGAQRFEVPPLTARASEELVRRAMPSLTGRLLAYVVAAGGGRPGALRGLMETLAAQPIASEADVDRALAGEVSSSEVPSEPYQRASYYLERGRFDDTRAALEAVPAQGDDARRLGIETLWARLELGLGDAPAALARLQQVSELARSAQGTPEAALWRLYVGRAYVSTGDYARALTVLAPLTEDPGALGAEALAFHGLGDAYLGNTEAALASFERAVARAREAGAPRVEAVALVSRGLVLQRADRIDDAREAYEQCIVAGERAGDAGLLSTAQLNLAGLLKVSGDIAGAVQRFEAAVDLGRRSGRRSTTRNALLNLANTDLYLGRVARARESIELLEEQRESLPPMLNAQLSGLQAELASRVGQLERAVRLYEASAAAYDAMGRSIDAAEALLEGLLVASRLATPDLEELRRGLAQADEALAGSSAHRPLRLLAASRVAWVMGDEARAQELGAEALAKAKEAGQKEWVWRALEALADAAEASERPTAARRYREEALDVLEGIAARLPRDLREVYWNDSRRRALKSRAERDSAALSRTELAGFQPRVAPLPPFGERSVISGFTSTPLEQRLAHLLEVNASLARERDLSQLAARITSHAVALVQAERGYLILVEPDGSLSTHTSRTSAGDPSHAEFSRGVARQVIDSGAPLVTTSARDDSRMQGYASVHQLSLQAVACVPIFAPGGEPIGALYVETRQRAGERFEAELATLSAFGDQAAIALEFTRLLRENQARAEALEQSNAQLREAQARLRELLEQRTERLRLTRRKLKDVQETLYGHFGYMGLVGTSRAMRRVYSLIERVKGTDVPVLITGESGTGKEVVARAIHQAGGRAKQAFLGVNCGAIPEHLLEGELFGHVRGAFTGADRDRKGLFREADGGSLLLDEIGEMPHRMQAGLLRVLQERKVRPVGGAVEQEVDVRVVCATNRDLQAMVEEGTFREDLFYRIHVVEVHIPPLRERTEDIPQLVDHFFGLFAARYKREKKAVSREAMKRLRGYHWPGNVRQLEHVLLNAWVLGEKPEVEEGDLDLPDGRAGAALFSTLTTTTTTSRSSSSSSGSASAKSTFSQHRLDERERILQALKASSWNRVKAAELLGMPRRTFYRRLRQYGIQ